MTQDSEERSHSCPNYGSDAIRRSLRGGIVENIFYRMIGLRPYRCPSCGERFFDRRSAAVRKESARD